MRVDVLFAEWLNASKGREQSHRWCLVSSYFPFSVAGSGLCPGCWRPAWALAKGQSCWRRASSRPWSALCRAGSCSASPLALELATQPCAFGTDSYNLHPGEAAGSKGGLKEQLRLGDRFSVHCQWLGGKGCSCLVPCTRVAATY